MAVTSKSQEASAQVKDTTAESRFWVSTYPFFTTTLFVQPPGVSGETVAETALTLYDADGAMINEAKMQFPGGRAGFVELDSLLGSCKLEGGLKHALLVLRSPAGTRHTCRIAQGDRTAALGELAEFSASQTAFLPVTFGENLLSFLVVCNYAKDEARVKCRMYLGSKSSEIELSIPSSGSRIISLEGDFADFADIADGEKRHGYVRLVTKSEETLGVQLIEKQGPAGSEEYRSVC